MDVHLIRGKVNYGIRCHSDMCFKVFHVLPVPAHREAVFTPERVVVPHLHDTVARFRPGTKFLLRCSNRGELAPV